MTTDSQTIENIYQKHFSSIKDDVPLFDIYKQAGGAYDEIHSLNKKNGFVSDDSLDNVCIYYIAGWIKENSSNKWIKNLSQDDIASGIANQILGYFETLNRRSIENQIRAEIFSSLPTNEPESKANEETNTIKSDAIIKTHEKNPWTAGSFYLVAAIVIFVTLSIMSTKMPWHVVGIILIGGIVLLTIIAAFEQRFDNVLTQNNFRKLMATTFRQLRFLDSNRTSTPNKRRPRKRR